MAKLSKKPQEDHSNDWLSTYSDMVTLLLTFFVMLYASSTTDEQKWQYIYQAFQSHGKYFNEYVDSPNPTPDEGDGTISEEPETNGGSGNLPQSFDQLYQYISQYVSENNLESSVSVEQGAAHLNIRFDNNVFFEPNSAVLTQEGKDLLNGIAPGITAVKNAIRTCTISGHTAKAISEVNDWDLSSDRAASVVKYMDFTKVLDTEQFRTKGCGYAEPVADNNTEEGRSQNRRVEMVLLKNDADFTDPEVWKDILKYDYGIDLDNIDPDAAKPEVEKLPNDYAQSVIDRLEEKYPDHSSSSGGFTLGPAIPGDYDSFMVSAEAEDSTAG
ncbi:MAG: flagellar motor protein MotB [Oscillospiraceae bacterium]